METLYLGSTGPYVKLVQSLLRNLGYNPGPVNGVFGPQTRQAVISFQLACGMVPDGLISPPVWNSISKFLKGYVRHILRPGDSMPVLAALHRTTIKAIEVANPGIDLEHPAEGQILTIPFGMDVVFTDVDYTYSIMEMDIHGLKARYPFLETGTAGKSVLGKNIYYLKIGDGKKQVFLCGAHHADDWVVSQLLMKLVENFSGIYAGKTHSQDSDISNIFSANSFYVIPMVNPDGVDLLLEGPRSAGRYSSEILGANKSGKPLPLVWKANVKGVDLELNYPAGWEKEKEAEVLAGITGPSPSGYAGPAPFSEPESTAVAEFTRDYDFSLALSFGIGDRAIAWQYLNLTPPGTGTIAAGLAQATGYALADAADEYACAGYTQWFTQEYRRPGICVRLGAPRQTFPQACFLSLYTDLETTVLLAAQLYDNYFK